VVNNNSRQRFEIVQEKHLAKLNYREHDGVIELVHTEVPEELSGRGLANKLAEAALTYARERHLKIVPSCSFVAKYISRHPEWQNLVA
jgi:predicted GNAT family acetyltransferase